MRCFPQAMRPTCWCACPRRSQRPARRMASPTPTRPGGSMVANGGIARWLHPSLRSRGGPKRTPGARPTVSVRHTTRPFTGRPFVVGSFALAAIKAQGVARGLTACLEVLLAGGAAVARRAILRVLLVRIFVGGARLAHEAHVLAATIGCLEVKDACGGSAAHGVRSYKDAQNGAPSTEQDGKDQDGENATQRHGERLWHEMRRCLALYRVQWVDSIWTTGSIETDRHCWRPRSAPSTRF